MDLYSTLHYKISNVLFKLVQTEKDCLKKLFKTVSWVYHITTVLDWWTGNQKQTNISLEEVSSAMETMHEGTSMSN